MTVHQPFRVRMFKGVSLASGIIAIGGIALAQLLDSPAILQAAIILPLCMMMFAMSLYTGLKNHE